MELKEYLLEGFSGCCLLSESYYNLVKESKTALEKTDTDLAEYIVNIIPLNEGEKPITTCTLGSPKDAIIDAEAEFREANNISAAISAKYQVQIKLGDMERYVPIIYWEGFKGKAS